MWRCLLPAFASFGKVGVAQSCRFTLGRPSVTQSGDSGLGAYDPLRRIIACWSHALFVLLMEFTSRRGFGDDVVGRKRQRTAPSRFLTDQDLPHENNRNRQPSTLFLPISSSVFLADDKSHDAKQSCMTGS